MSNDTPSWSGDDTGAAPPPPPPSPSPSEPGTPSAVPHAGADERSWGAPSEPWTTGQTKPASLAKRFGARIIDGLVVGVPLGILLIFGMGFDPSGVVYTVLTSVINLAYFVLLESSQGGTLGKRLLGMTVTATTGGNLSTDAAFKRNWWLLLSVVPIIGPLASLGVTIYIAITISGDERNQGFHDKLADAVVLDR